MVKRILAILPISIGGRLTMSSIIDGYRQNGCEVSVYDELNPVDTSEILKQNYHHIVGYDYSSVIFKFKTGMNIPTANYFSDEIRKNMSGKYWQEYVSELSKDDNYTFYWDKALTEKEKNNIKNIFYLPHFVNTDVYRDLGIKPEVDVMFAGRLDTDYRLRFFEELVSKLPEYNFAWYAIEKHYEDAKNRAINSALIDCCYKGFIDNEYDMAKAVNRTKIVFNMNSQGISSLNYRTFQTVACKRLLISDYRDELSLFEGNIPYYTDIEDLSIKIRQYLANETLYNTVCEKCFELVNSYYNSQLGAKFMLENVE